MMADGSGSVKNRTTQSSRSEDAGWRRLNREKAVRHRSGGHPRKEGSSAPQALDEGSDESKFKPRLREAYVQKVVPALMKEFGYKNIMQVPKLERIVLNVGMGEAIQNVKLLESAAGEMVRLRARSL